MTVREVLNEGSGRLSEAAIDTARLDSSLILCHCLNITREKLFASLPDDVPDEALKMFGKLIEMRLDHHPVAYLTGTKEFFGLPFHVEEGVLCPRPDTELLVETVLSLTEKDKALKDVLDMCTGTGCIAVSLKNSDSSLNVSASDISPVAEKVFSINNCTLADGSINFTKSSLFEKIEGTFDIIVTNPPYLTTGETEERMEEGWKEPALALDGGNDGLDLIRIIIGEAPDYLNEGGYLLIEAHPAQMESMKVCMESEGFRDIAVLKDLPGLDRVICGRKGPVNV
ncbi:peptide chain release factor N(5)-glutamine methyltransferase [Spirochaeta isovalerica]|uniref:Release factor glutamine methyltransferase n=1 Tax=Spirochaeta isovalerica TaxID=150 RepID=A0A841RGJ1_9SPIO|nr:peptide chain release factor N(5)-glutamine methyltransferase [Spirochaeta isovalerica]MBB6481638.1 release factor glutamine methyltransferase [Spirochaeta isovalerica]